MADNQQAEHARIGSIAGLGAGVIAGAQVGTVLLPIPIIGTFAGALIGSWGSVRSHSPIRARCERRATADR